MDEGLPVAAAGPHMIRGKPPRCPPDAASLPHLQQAVRSREGTSAPSVGRPMTAPPWLGRDWSNLDFSYLLYFWDVSELNDTCHSGFPAIVK